MTVLSMTKGRSKSVRKCVDYTSKDGRSLAHDYVNCCEVDISGYDVSKQFDDIREAFPVKTKKGQKPLTFMHYIISPKKDSCTLDQLRDLSIEWVNKNFPEFQATIAYHDDNASHILHSHVIVNGVSLTGIPISTWLTKQRANNLNPSLQVLSEQRGIEAFKTNNQQSHRHQKQKSGSRSYMSGAEREAINRGARSWKQDIRDVSDAAKRCSTTLVDYKRACKAMGVEVTETSDHDFMYQFSDQHSRKVRGDRLGSEWSLRGVEWRLTRDYEAKVAKPEKEERQVLLNALENQNSKIAFVGYAKLKEGDLSARDVADMLGVCCSHDVRSMKDLRAVVSTTSDKDEVGKAQKALSTAERIGYLPEQTLKNVNKRNASKSSYKSNAGTSTKKKQTTSTRSTQQQHQQQKNRNGQDRGSR